MCVFCVENEVPFPAVSFTWLDKFLKKSKKKKKG